MMGVIFNLIRVLYLHVEGVHLCLWIVLCAGNGCGRVGKLSCVLGPFMEIGKDWFFDYDQPHFSTVFDS